MSKYKYTDVQWDCFKLFVQGTSRWKLHGSGHPMSFHIIWMKKCIGATMKWFTCGSVGGGKTSQIVTGSRGELGCLMKEKGPNFKSIPLNWLPHPILQSPLLPPFCLVTDTCLLYERNQRNTLSLSVEKNTKRVSERGIKTRAKESGASRCFAPS